jgi:hypothetical protein
MLPHGVSAIDHERARLVYRPRESRREIGNFNPLYKANFRLCTPRSIRGAGWRLQGDSLGRARRLVQARMIDDIRQAHAHHHGGLAE